VQKETPDELDCIDGTGLAVLGVEADLATVEGPQAVIGDANSVGIAPEILKDLGSPTKRLLGVYDPLSVEETRLQLGKFRRIVEKGRQSVDEFATKDLRHRLDWK